MPAHLEKAVLCLCEHLLLYGSNRDKLFIRSLSSFRLAGKASVEKKVAQTMETHPAIVEVLDQKTLA